MDSIRNGLQFADYKRGLARSNGVGGVNSRAANNESQRQLNPEPPVHSTAS